MLAPWKKSYNKPLLFSGSVMSDLRDPMACSTPGFPVHHQLLELAQTHVHRVGDAIQPAHPLSSPSPPIFNLSCIRVFSNESVLRIRWPKYWSFSFNISPSSESSGLISFRMDWLDLLAVQGTLKSLLQHHRYKPVNIDTLLLAEVRRIPWRRAWQPTPVFLPGESHGQRSLARL